MEEKIAGLTATEMKGSRIEVRTFDTGANRDTDEGKLDYEGFLSPLVLERYAQYLHGHRTLPDGTTRDSDNWQKGMPLVEYMKSAWRHFMVWWKMHRSQGEICTQDREDAICGLIFNASGYLHEVLKKKLVVRDTGRPVVIPPRSDEEVVGYDISAERPIYKKSNPRI